jgi:type II secretion system protein C
LYKLQASSFKPEEGGKMINHTGILITSLVSLAMTFQGLTFLSKPKATLNQDSLTGEALLNKVVISVMQASGSKLQAPSFKLQTKEGLVTSDNMEEEELQLELLGTAISNVKDPIAFIKDLSSNKQGIYRLGSVIGEAKITGITIGEVALDINGRKETLKLSRRAMAWANRNKQIPAIISVSGDRIVVSKNGLLNESDSIINTLRNVKVRPYYQAKQVLGMIVEGVPENSIITNAGIRNKDIIRTMNNQKIDSYQKALQVFNKARNQSEVKVSLLREGQTKNLSYFISK